MSADYALFAAVLLIAALVALPLLQALQRRRRSRECSEVANALLGFAAKVRASHQCSALDEDALGRLRRLGTPEFAAFEFAQQLTRVDPVVLADSAQRLALRLKRRVAFERKMLARTASGRRRGALAASAPGVAMLALRLGEVTLPWPALLLLLAVEALGCWLLWRVARVEV
jgi:hypothetical protein